MADKRSSKDIISTVTVYEGSGLSSNVDAPTRSDGIELRENPSDSIPRAGEVSLSRARELRDRNPQRLGIPVRNSFVRGDESRTPPLHLLVSRRGRGGGTPLKLYLALIWLSSGAPFDSTVSARVWAELLDLPDAAKLGARRITSALETLSDLDLIELQRKPGEPSRVILLEESGAGEPYTLPSTQYQRAPKDEKEAHLYFKLPIALWCQGYLQHMSAAGVAMLLAIASEYRPGDEPIWWSTEKFPTIFHLSHTMRANGTRELVNLGLLNVTPELVTPTPTRSFGGERVRNHYRLISAARSAKDSDKPRNQKNRKRPAKLDEVARALGRGAPGRT